MSWDRVSVLTGPTERSMTIDDIKCRIRIDTNVDDALLMRFIQGAESLIDGPLGIGYALMSQTWRLSLDSFCETIYLPGAPIKSVASVNYVDTAGADQVVDSANWHLDIRSTPVRLVPAYGTTWPATRGQNGAVWVDYVLGETDSDNIEASLIDALSLLVGHRDANREATSEIKLHSLPLGVESILAEYRQSGVAA